MANEKDADEHSRTELIDELTSQSPALETAKQDSSDSKDKEDLFPRVPFYKLFSFADPMDYVLMVTGSIAAVGSGISVPLMTLLFGQLVDSFGHTGNTKEVANEVSKVIPAILIG